MKENDIDILFKQLKGHFDTETPDAGHEKRFLNKLNATQNPTTITKGKSWHNTLKPVLAIAATIVVLLAVFIGINNNKTRVNDLNNVSPKMAQTQSFFNGAITEELKKLKLASTPETQKIVQDALEQIKILENNYQTLKIDLAESGNDNRVIHAMITNFQNRITILQSALNQIAVIKQLNTQTHDTKNTI